MSTVEYVGLNGAARLSDAPRRVYRVVVAPTFELAARNAAFWPLFQWTFLDAVRAGVDAGLSPIAKYLGNPSVDAGDSRATFDVMATASSGAADVRGLVAAIDGKSKYWRVVQVADAGNVPGFSGGGPGTLSAGRDAAQDAARAAAEEDSLAGRARAALGAVGDALAGSLSKLVIVAAVALLLVVLIRSGGGRSA